MEIPVAAPVATVLAAAIALRPAYLQYKAKIREDVRLTEAARAETDIRLLNLFTDLMAKAHARGEDIVVGEAVAAILADEGDLKPSSLTDMKEVLRSCTVTLPVGAAEQEGAIAAVAELGCRYEVLHRPALAGLEHLISWHENSEAAPKALERLRACSTEIPERRSRTDQRGRSKPS